MYGITYEVEFDEDIVAEDGAFGLAVYNKQKIKLLPSSKTFPVSQEKQAQTFCHELMHFIFFHASGRDEEIYSDERLVDACGSLLHQALTSMEYK